MRLSFAFELCVSFVVFILSFSFNPLVPSTHTSLNTRSLLSRSLSLLFSLCSSSLLQLQLMRAQADTVLNMTLQSSSMQQQNHSMLDVSGSGPSFSMMSSNVSEVDVSILPPSTTARGVSHKTSQLLASMNLNTSIGQSSRSMLLESPSKSFVRGVDQKISESSAGGRATTAHQAGWYQRGYWKTKYQKF